MTENHRLLDVSERKAYVVVLEEAWKDCVEVEEYQVQRGLRSQESELVVCYCWKSRSHQSRLGLLSSTLVRGKDRNKGPNVPRPGIYGKLDEDKSSIY